MRISDVTWVGLLAIILITNPGCSNSELGDPGNAEVVANKNRESEARIGIKDADSLVELGISKLEKAPSDFAGAVSDFDKAILLKPSLPSAFFNRGVAKQYLGELEAALADFTQAIQLDPRAATYTFRGRVKYELGDLPGAMADLDHAVRLDPTYSLAFFQRGNCKRELEDYRGAIQDFDKSIQIDPMQETAYFQRGYAKKMLEDFEGSVLDYSEAIRINPNYVTAFVGRGLVKRTMEDFPGAIEDFDEALRQKPDATVYGFRGSATADMGDHADALMFFDNALELDPTYAEGYFLRGRSKFALSDFGGAITDFSETIRIEPENVDALRDRAEVKEKLKDYDGALSDLNRVIEIEPNVGMNYFFRGYLFETTKNYSRAVADYENALRIDDKNLTYFLKLSFLLSTCHEDSIRDPKRATLLALQAVEIDSDNPYAMNARACAFAAEGDFDSAIQWEKKAMASPVYMKDDDLDGGKHSDDRIKKWEAKTLWLTPLGP